MAIRNNRSVLIQGYSPEEYAAQWGGDSSFDRHPLKPGDGALFYNFSSEHVLRDRAWLDGFSAAIGRTIEMVKARPDHFQPDDLAGLESLKAHVESLTPETELPR